MRLEWTHWYVVAGILLIGMALSGTRLKRLPLTTSLLYLLVGVALGPWGLGAIRLDPVGSAAVLERVTEFAVIVSLFTAGLKLRAPFSDRAWGAPVRLASVSMVVTVGLIAAAGVLWLDLPLGAAVLLGAVLAPTDPVLASDVQVAHPGDRDRLRFGLTGEAGLNDGTAFPFVMLGLVLLGVRDGGALGWRWVAVDVVWAITAGLVIGAVAGTIIGRLVVYLRRTHREAVGLDEFLSLGLLALSYGTAVSLHAYGFLAAFAAGAALRRVETQAADKPGGGDTPDPGRRDEDGNPPADVGASAEAGKAEEIATAPDTAPAYMAQAVLGFNEQLDRLCEVAVVVLIGAMLGPAFATADAAWFVPLLLIVIRPLAVLVGLAGSGLRGKQRALTCWFGIRGVGSLYYLTYALHHGFANAGASGGDAQLPQRLAALTLTVIAASVVVHGVSVTPLMDAYGGEREEPNGQARDG